MNENSIRTITTVAVLVIVFAALMSILKWLIGFLLPLAIIIIAAYLVYKLFKRNSY
jgi:uncharacterized membrane protein